MANDVDVWEQLRRARLCAQAGVGLFGGLAGRLEADEAPMYLVDRMRQCMHRWQTVLVALDRYMRPRYISKSEFGELLVRCLDVMGAFKNAARDVMDCVKEGTLAPHCLLVLTEIEVRREMLYEEGVLQVKRRFEISRFLKGAQAYGRAVVEIGEGLERKLIGYIGDAFAGL